MLNNTVKNTGTENMGLDLRDIAGTGSREEKIKRIAIQFEEMLINTLLKEAFKEEKNDDEEGTSLTSGSYKDLSTMFLSQYIADNGGLGYREVIERQLKEAYGDNVGTTKETTSASASQPVTGVTGAPGEPAGRTAPTVKKPASEPLKVTQPVSGPVSSEYGWRRDPIDGKTRFHAGIDYEVRSRTPVKSVMEGEVVFSGWEKGYGNLVEIEHPNGYRSRYGHNAALLVKKGDHVESGDVISLSGSSGRSTGPHLHFELRKGEFSLDPVKILDPMSRGVLAKK
jgi:murein DD-endopeptidase MepM/ murein hydrolase activator NlpD